MSTDKYTHTVELYKDMLKNQVMSFWERYGIDTVNGGIFTGLDRKGVVIESDKSVWFQGRACWVFATLYNEIEQKADWLKTAQLCVEFIDKCCFDIDGKMFFRVTKEGAPVIKRERYVFSEAFAIIGYAAYAQASGNQNYIEKARKVLYHIYSLVDSNVLIPKFNREVRPLQGLGYHMIMLNTLQELRKSDMTNADEYTKLIMQHIDSIRIFVRDDMRCVLEQVGKDNEFLFNHIEGRLINPGHSIEAGWFILQEATYQKNKELQDLAIKIINYAWEWGWDTEYGGMVYFRDALHYPVSEYWHDMKFWWPQNEAVIANLMAYQITGESTYWDRYTLTIDWVYNHFIDLEYGEWFGYLHRDGSISSEIKGNMFKGPFHIPRMYLQCISIFADMCVEQKHKSV